jgi:hypothetical protein
MGSGRASQVVELGAEELGPEELDADELGAEDGAVVDAGAGAEPSVLAAGVFVSDAADSGPDSEPDSDAGSLLLAA